MLRRSEYFVKISLSKVRIRELELESGGPGFECTIPQQCNNKYSTNILLELHYCTNIISHNAITYSLVYISIYHESGASKIADLQ